MREVAWLIDDGPLFEQLLVRKVNAFDSSLRRWPWPPQRARVGDYRDWTDHWRCRFEDTLFAVGLGIRKLVEAGKVSVEAQLEPIPARVAPLLGDRLPDSMNVHRVEEFYDVDKAAQDSLPLMLLCHAIVHSYVLQPKFARTGASGLYVESFVLASDVGRRKGAYLIEWDQVRRLVYRLAFDDVVSVRLLRTGQGEQLKIPRSTHSRSAKDEVLAIQLYRSVGPGNCKEIDRFMKVWRERFGRNVPPFGNRVGE